MKYTAAIAPRCSSPVVFMRAFIEEVELRRGSRGARERSGFFHRLTCCTFDYALEEWDGRGGRTPRLSWAEWSKGAGQACEEFGLGMTGCEGQTDAAGGFDHASGDLDQPQAQRRELGLGQIAGLGNGVSDG